MLSALSVEQTDNFVPMTILFKQETMQVLSKGLLVLLPRRFDCQPRSKTAEGQQSINRGYRDLWLRNPTRGGIDELTFESCP